MNPIYLDYNATTPIAPSVQEAMLPFLAEHFGNPSSGHALGRAAREAIEDARAQVAQLLSADRGEIIFTGGGTESNNLAFKGTALRDGDTSRRHLVISAIEHPAVVEPARFLERLGFSLTVVPCNAQGIVEPAAVADALRPDTLLVSIMHANNEIGTLQPIAEIAGQCRQRDVLVHCDAAQSVGKVALDVNELGVDMLTIAGHKFYAPKGVGALYVRRGVRLEPLLHGAAHESGRRAGTENTSMIVGLGRAADLVCAGRAEFAARMSGLRDRLWAALRDGSDGALKFNGDEQRRLPNTLSVRFAGVAGRDILARVPEVYASTGAACHSASGTSGTLAALGLTSAEAQSTVRLSLGWSTNEDEIDRAASLLLDAWESLR